MRPQKLKLFQASSLPQRAIWNKQIPNFKIPGVSCPKPQCWLLTALQKTRHSHPSFSTRLPPSLAPSILTQSPRCAGKRKATLAWRTKLKKQTPYARAMPLPCWRQEINCGRLMTMKVLVGNTARLPWLFLRCYSNTLRKRFGVATLSLLMPDWLNKRSS